MSDALPEVGIEVHVHLLVITGALHINEISMKIMKTVVFDSSFVARLGKYTKTKSRMIYFGVGGMTYQNHNKPCFIFLQSAL